MKRSTAWLTAIALSAGAGIALAQQAPDGPPGMGRGMGPGMGRHGMGPDHVAQALGLSDDQKTAWDAAHKDFMESSRPLHEKAMTLERDLRDTLDKGGADPATVGKKAIALHDLHTQMKAAHESLQAKLEALLTPEQKLKFEGFRAAMSHDGPGFGPHGMGGPGGFGGPRGPRPPEDEN